MRLGIESGAELQACTNKASCSAMVTKQPIDNFELIDQASSRNPGYISPTTTEGGGTDTSYFRDVGIGSTSSSGATMIAPKAAQGCAVSDDALLMDFLSSFWVDTDGATAPPQTSPNAADSIHARTDGNIEVSRDGGCLFDMSSDKSFCERGDVVASDADGKVVGRPSAASLCVTEMEQDDISVLTEVVVTLDLPELATDLSEAGLNTKDDERKKRNVLRKSDKQEGDKTKTNPVPTTVFVREWSCTPTLDELKRLLKETKTKTCQTLDYVLDSDAVAYVTNTPVYKRLSKSSLRSASSSGGAMKRLAVAKQSERKTLQQSHTKITAFVYHEKRQEKNYETHDGLGDERDDLDGRKEPEQRKDILLVGDDEEREAAPVAPVEGCQKTSKDNETQTPTHLSEPDFAPSASVKQAQLQGILRRGNYQPRPSSLDGGDTSRPISKAVRSTRSTRRFRETSGKTGRAMRPSHSNRFKSTREANGRKRPGSNRPSSY